MTESKRCEFIVLISNVSGISLMIPLLIYVSTFIIDGYLIIREGIKWIILNNELFLSFYSWNNSDIKIIHTKFSLILLVNMFTHFHKWNDESTSLMTIIFHMKTKINQRNYSWIFWMKFIDTWKKISLISIKILMKYFITFILIFDRISKCIWNYNNFLKDKFLMIWLRIKNK